MTLRGWTLLREFAKPRAARLRRLAGSDIHHQACSGQAALLAAAVSGRICADRRGPVVRTRRQAPPCRPGAASEARWGWTPWHRLRLREFAQLRAARVRRLAAPGIHCQTREGQAALLAAASATSGRIGACRPQSCREASPCRPEGAPEARSDPDPGGTGRCCKGSRNCAPRRLPAALPDASGRIALEARRPEARRERRELMRRRPCVARTVDRRGESGCGLSSRGRVRVPGTRRGSDRPP